MRILGFKLPKKNSAQTRFVIFQTLFLLVISLGIYKVYSDWQISMLEMSQAEKEALAVSEITHIIKNRAGEKIKSEITNYLENPFLKHSLFNITVKNSWDSILYKIDHVEPNTTNLDVASHENIPNDKNEIHTVNH